MRSRTCSCNRPKRRLSTRSRPRERLAWVFLNYDASIAVSRRLLAEGPHAGCRMSVSRSLKDKCQDVLLLWRELQGPLSEDGGIAPTKLEGTGGASAAPCTSRVPPRRARLGHHSLPTRPGRASPLCRWGRLLPVAETDDIFISLSKPPLFMEVSPG